MPTVSQKNPSGARSGALTVRVGCRLVYEPVQRTPMLLDVRPQLENGQRLLEEKLILPPKLEAVRFFSNAHDNELLRLVLPPGRSEFVHDALVEVAERVDVAGIERASAMPPEKIPSEILRYILPSRYCESDRLADFAWKKFGRKSRGWEQVRSVLNWVHRNIEYRFGSGDARLSAWDVFQRKHGVCRDFAHLAIALLRALNYPTRYVTGHLPDIGFKDPGTPMDFHAYAEVFLGGKWFGVDARFAVPRIGRIKISHGRDAADCAFGMTFGSAPLTYFEVWAYQVARGTVQVGDPIDLRLRLDGTPRIRRN